MRITRLTGTLKRTGLCPHLVFEPLTSRRSNPIVFLHGILGNKNNWRGICRKMCLEHEYKSYSLDSRHHGDWGQCGKFNYLTMAKDIKNFMDHYNLPKINLVGHSMGGKTAMTFSQLYPHFLSSLTIVDIAPINVRQSDLILGYIKIMFDIDLNQVTTRQEIRKILMEKLKDSFLTDFIMMNLIGNGGEKLRWSYTPQPFIDSFKDLAYFPEFTPSYHGDTLFIIGGASEYVNKNDYPAIKRLYPQAEIIELPQIGHLVHIEAPLEFVKILASFIQKNDKVT